MYPTVEYEMTEEDLKELLEVMKPVPCIMVGGYSPPSPQENANNAWKKLGEKMGFDYMSVRPSNKGNRFFTATPSETELQRKERIKKEQDDAKSKEIEKLESEIKERQDRLKDLLTEGKDSPPNADRMGEE